MAVWCLSTQKVGYSVIQGLCGQLVAALVDVLSARRWASRCAKHYSAAALTRLLNNAPGEASALCSHWLPPICSLALEAGGACDPKQTAILRRQSRICLERLLVVLPSSDEELVSRCVAECLVSHGLLERMENLISAVTGVWLRTLRTACLSFLSAPIPP